MMLNSMHDERKINNSSTSLAPIIDTHREKFGSKFWRRNNSLANTFYQSNDFLTFWSISVEQRQNYLNIINAYFTHSKATPVNLLVANADFLSMLAMDDTLPGAIIIMDIDEILLEHIENKIAFLREIANKYLLENHDFNELKPLIESFYEQDSDIGLLALQDRQNQLGENHWLANEKNFHKTMEALQIREIFTLNIDLFSEKEQASFAMSLKENNIEVAYVNLTNLGDYSDGSLSQFLQKLPLVENTTLLQWNLHDRGFYRDKYEHYLGYSFSTQAYDAFYGEQLPRHLAWMDCIHLLERFYVGGLLPLEELGQLFELSDEEEQEHTPHNIHHPQFKQTYLETIKVLFQEFTLTYGMNTDEKITREQVVKQFKQTHTNELSKAIMGPVGTSSLLDKEDEERMFSLVDTFKKESIEGIEDLSKHAIKFYRYYNQAQQQDANWTEEDYTNYQQAIHAILLEWSKSINCSNKKLEEEMSVLKAFIQLPARKAIEEHPEYAKYIFETYIRNFKDPMPSKIDEEKYIEYRLECVVMNAFAEQGCLEAINRKLALIEHFIKYADEDSAYLLTPQDLQLFQPDIFLDDYLSEMTERNLAIAFMSIFNWASDLGSVSATNSLKDSYQSRYSDMPFSTDMVVNKLYDKRLEQLVFPQWIELLQKASNLGDAKAAKKLSQFYFCGFYPDFDFSHNLYKVQLLQPDLDMALLYLNHYLEYNNNHRDSYELSALVKLYLKYREYFIENSIHDPDRILKLLIHSFDHASMPAARTEYASAIARHYRDGLTETENLDKRRRMVLKYYDAMLAQDPWSIELDEVTLLYLFGDAELNIEPNVSRAYELTQWFKHSWTAKAILREIVQFSKDSLLDNIKHYLFWTFSRCKYENIFEKHNELSSNLLGLLENGTVNSDRVDITESFVFPEAINEELAREWSEFLDTASKLFDKIWELEHNNMYANYISVSHNINSFHTQPKQQNEIKALKSQYWSCFESQEYANLIQKTYEHFGVELEEHYTSTKTNSNYF